ncbi:MAG: hypothetical protein IIA64_05735 [Planctomycetes bacterium]|nr:hypothetical protein [Planctomycetota bacterium]
MPKEQLSDQLNIRVSSDQIVQWSKTADRDDRTLSAWIRHTLDKAAAKAPRKR